MNRIGVLAVVVVLALASTSQVSAQDDMTIYVPSFDVRMSMGFNYDLLRPLTSVDFDRPVGYFGANLWFLRSPDVSTFLDGDILNEVFGDSSLFRAGENFKPTGTARQNSNYTVRVDVPMIGGVGSFAYTQNFFFDFNSALGGANVISAFQDLGSIAGDDDGAPDMEGYVSVKGALRLPLSITMGWETMTFGYAYKVDEKGPIFAVNLHRHVFSLDTRLRADIDILGHVKLDASMEMPEELGGGRMPIQNLDDEIINFSSDVCNGSAQGRYRAEAWTPSFGVKWNRFSLNSRMGMNVKAKGSASGSFTVPRVIDLETGQLANALTELADSIGHRPEYIFDAIAENGSLIPDEVDHVAYEIGETLRWKMPHGHTLGFDIIPNRVSLSYTKLFGDINMKIDNIVRTTRYDTDDPNSWLHSDNDTLNVDIGIRIDHILMFQLTYPSFFLNIGICGLEAWSKDADGKTSYALANVDQLKAIRFDGVAMMLPILGFGVDLGTKLKVRLEADLLPLFAIKTGVLYYF